MNGGQDLGGMMGFGPVVAEPNEPVFHGKWESRVLAINVAVGAGGLWNIDMSRHAREKISPRDYLAFSYYQIWLAGLLDLTQRTGMVAPEELANGGSPVTPPVAVRRVLKADDVLPALTKGWPSERPSNVAAKFKVGQKIRAKNINPKGHTRLPRYVRGHVGTIDAVRGVHVFPDSNSSSMDEAPVWLYTVRFDALELWGPDAPDPAVTVSIDAFEPYLDAA